MAAVFELIYQRWKIWIDVLSSQDRFFSTEKLAWLSYKIYNNAFVEFIRVINKQK